MSCVLKTQQVRLVLPVLSWMCGLLRSVVDLQGDTPLNKILSSSSSSYPVVNSPSRCRGASAHPPSHAEILCGLLVHAVTAPMWNCSSVFRKQFPFTHPLPLPLAASSSAMIPDPQEEGLCNTDVLLTAEHSTAFCFLHPDQLRPSASTENRSFVDES